MYSTKQKCAKKYLQYVFSLYIKQLNTSIPRIEKTALGAERGIQGSKKNRLVLQTRIEITITTALSALELFLKKQMQIQSKNAGGAGHRGGRGPSVPFLDVQSCFSQTCLNQFCDPGCRTIGATLSYFFYFVNLLRRMSLLKMTSFRSCLSGPILSLFLWKHYFVVDHTSEWLRTQRRRMEVELYQNPCSLRVRRWIFHHRA
jgi:hypothetical protein